VIRLAEMIRDQVDQELYNPAAVRRQIEEAEEARASGQLSDEESAKAQEEAVGRLTGQAPAASGPGPPAGERR
ncbi:MAG: gas vesicle protein G, partial [Actinobacteria bacterium]|nr:gas vesicle protein G [Actinomycetota bacterium]